MLAVGGCFRRAPWTVRPGVQYRPFMRFIKRLFVDTDQLKKSIRMLESRNEHLHDDVERLKIENEKLIVETGTLKWKLEYMNKIMLKLAKSQNEINIKMVEELKSKLDLPLNTHEKQKYQLLIDIKEYQIRKAEEFEILTELVLIDRDKLDMDFEKYAEFMGFVNDGIEYNAKINEKLEKMAKQISAAQVVATENPELIKETVKIVRCSQTDLNAVRKELDEQKRVEESWGVNRQILQDVFKSVSA